LSERPLYPGAQGLILDAGRARPTRALARLILREHVCCLAAMAGVLVLQLGFG